MGVGLLRGGVDGRWVAKRGCRRKGVGSAKPHTPAVTGRGLRCDQELSAKWFVRLTLPLTLTLTLTLPLTLSLFASAGQSRTPIAAVRILFFERNTTACRFVLFVF